MQSLQYCVQFEDPACGSQSHSGRKASATDWFEEEHCVLFFAWPCGLLLGDLAFPPGTVDVVSTAGRALGTCFQMTLTPGACEDLPALVPSIDKFMPFASSAFAMRRLFKMNKQTKLGDNGLAAMVTSFGWYPPRSAPPNLPVQAQLA